MISLVRLRLGHPILEESCAAVGMDGLSAERSLKSVQLTILHEGAGMHSSRLRFDTADTIQPSMHQIS